MATFESFDCFSSDLILGRHNFLKDEFRVMLTNTRPVKELSSLKSITHLELPRKTLLSVSKYSSQQTLSGLRNTGTVLDRLGM